MSRVFVARTRYLCAVVVLERWPFPSTERNIFPKTQNSMSYVGLELHMIDPPSRDTAPVPAADLPCRN